jgi:DnaJ-class molecular chaperone
MADQGGMPDMEGMDINDLFGNMFNGGGRSRRRRGFDKRDEIVQQLKLTLEELYAGVEKTIKINKQKVCVSCNGVGAKKKSDVKTCSSCKGRGFKVVRRPVGPNMVQEMEMECDSCGTTGETIAKSCRCPECEGKKVIRKDTNYTVTVPAGCHDGEQLVQTYIYIYIYI